MRGAGVVVPLMFMCCAVCGGQSYMASNALPVAKETSRLPASTLQPQTTTVYSMIEVNFKQAADGLKEYPIAVLSGYSRLLRPQ
jgi:hypothetical protein